MKFLEKFFPYFLLAGILINANGLLNDILEPDGALYATISKHIELNSDWINLIGDGHDWLDKPHLHFWISAISFKIFGITPFAYKFPAFIFWLIGTCFTYKLAEELYGNFTAKVATIIYIFSLHNILNNFDVRAEPYLTAFTIAAIYFVYKTYTSGKWYFVVLAALMAAGAVMTKGIFVLITIGGGLVIFWIITKQWKQFLNLRWWLMAILILLFITPELYSLYVQFDLHPEKVVFGKTNVSGLRFFFWDSQFGRFFNTGPIKGHGDKSFFVHTTLWAFLPWSIIFYIAVFTSFRNRLRTDNPVRWIIYGSAAVTFLIFSMSRFQLPHYIVILFPHFSIITASYLISVTNENTLKKISVLQTVLLILGFVAICLLCYFSKFGNLVLVVTITLLLVIATLLITKKPGIRSIMVRGSALSVILFLFLHNFFYPRLLQYQAGMMAGKWLLENQITTPSATFKSLSYSFEFYAPGFIERIDSIAEVDNFLRSDSSKTIYTSTNNLKELADHGLDYSILKHFPYFHISVITGKFLNPATRSDQLEDMVLVNLKRKS